MNSVLVLVLGLASALSAFAQQGRLPDPRLTPGSIMAGVSPQMACTVGYSRSVRYVPVAKKREVYREYRIPYVKGEDEVDHLIPLVLLGSNDISNLWPEPYGAVWGAREKDALESRLHHLVCRGQISLPDAQRIIASNWIEAYKKVFHTSYPKYQQRIYESDERASR